VLWDISFSLNDKENLVITGASGSGKTTLAKALCGQLFVTGDLKISYDADNGLLPVTVYVGQHYQIKNRNNLVEGYYQQRYNSADNENSFTVTEELKRISSGMQRLVLLIRVFIKNPPLLILDEPCQGLDEYQTKLFVKWVDDI